MLVAGNRNRFLAAKNFFATHLPLPQYNRNEFGGNFSGPVYLPRLYDGRNKTFFFFNYEGFRRRQASTKTASVPTADLRQGNFAGLPAVNDPFNGGNPFPNNIIPADRINAATKRIQEFYPLPNRPGTGAGGLGNNLTENLPLPEDATRYSWRFDHYAGTSDRFSFSLL